jgi:hypothetical protein
MKVFIGKKLAMDVCSCAIYRALGMAQYPHQARFIAQLRTLAVPLPHSLDV